MDESIKKVKQIAASAMARKDKYEEELKALETEKAKRVADRDLAVNADDDALALQLMEIVSGLDDKIEAASIQFATAEADYGEIVAELKNIKDAKDQFERNKLRAPVAEALNPDPFAQSPTDIALENVRRHAAELDARVTLEQELRVGADADRELERKIAALEKKEAEARARAQLAELKAKKRQAKDGGPAADAATLDKPPKKTM